MAITVFESTKLDTFKNFRLIAGHRGLDRVIEKVGILDYEFVTRTEGQFGKNEFIISSLFFAKNDSSLIIDAIKDLAESGVSGLAIKNIYYDDLPSEAIDYANDNSLPIFIFDNSVFFEDIITEIMDRIRSVDNYEILETKVDILIKKSLNKATVREIAYEINSSFKEHFFVIYLKEKSYMGNSRIIELLERLKRKRNVDIYTSVFKYANGILIISTYEHIGLENFRNKVNALLQLIGINREDHYIGIGNLHANLEELNKGISESIFSQKTSEASKNNVNYFEDIGIYSILMPYLDDIWVQNFYNRIVKPIKNYDEKYNTEMFATAVKYIENDGRISETAAELFLHKNTIRYRLSKIKELLNMEKSEGSFYEQLSIAIKLHKIYNM